MLAADRTTKRNADRVGPQKRAPRPSFRDYRSAAAGVKRHAKR
jgi:hypothetical protein